MQYDYKKDHMKYNTMFVISNTFVLYMYLFRKLHYNKGV